MVVYEHGFRVLRSIDDKRCMLRRNPEPVPMTRARLKEAVAAIASHAERVAGPNQAQTRRLRELLSDQRRMLLVAALREIATPPHSWPDVGEALKCSHSAALTDWERWSALPWRDRYSWLDLVERTVNAIEESSNVETR